MKFTSYSFIELTYLICLILIILSPLIFSNGDISSVPFSYKIGNLANFITGFSLPAILILLLILLIIIVAVQNRYIKQRQVRAHINTRLEVFKSNFESLTIELLPRYNIPHLPDTTFGVFHGHSALFKLIQILKENKNLDDFREANGTDCRIFILRSEFLLSEINSFCHYYSTLKQNKEQQAEIFEVLSTYVVTFNSVVSAAENYKLFYSHRNEKRPFSVDSLIALKGKIDHFFNVTRIDNG